MASFEIHWKGTAERDLRKLDKHQIPRIISAVESLIPDPFPPQSRKLEGSERNYRIRIGDYRIIYQVDNKTKILTIYHIRHRKEAYRKE